MEDREDITITESGLPENSIGNTSAQAEPLVHSLDAAEFIYVEESVIREEEPSGAFPLFEELPLNLSTSSLPNIVPFTSNGPETSDSTTNNEDDDLYIVYEKKGSPAEVQILDDYISPNTQPKKKHRIPQTSSDQDRCHNCGSELINLSLVDTILIVERNVYVEGNAHVAQSENQSNFVNSLEPSVAESAEKKKTKIECAICFEGPDEIAANGHNVVSTVCGHIFCSNCIKEAIKNTKRCPQCRKKLTMKQFHVLYL